MDGPRIPDKPETLITRQPTLHEKIETERKKQEALAKMRELTKHLRMPK
jgi:hypothetical protein